jgi:hypothetical protein
MTDPNYFPKEKHRQQTIFDFVIDKKNEKLRAAFISTIMQFAPELAKRVHLDTVLKTFIMKKLWKSLGAMMKRLAFTGFFCYQVNPLNH